MAILLLIPSIVPVGASSGTAHADWTTTVSASNGALHYSYEIKFDFDWSGNTVTRIYNIQGIEQTASGYEPGSHSEQNSLVSFFSYSCYCEITQGQVSGTAQYSLFYIFTGYSISMTIIAYPGGSSWISSSTYT